MITAAQAFEADREQRAAMRGDKGKKLAYDFQTREEVAEVTDWTLAEVLEEVDERGLDPATVTVEYRGCGSHEVALRAPKPTPNPWEV